MFELEKAIAEWRARMAEGGVKGTARLDELEAHLREDVAQRTKQGVEPQRAFESAVALIGAAGELKREFRKAGLSGAEFDRKLLFVVTVVAMPVHAAMITSILLVNNGLDLSWAQRTSGLGAETMTVLLIFSGYICQRFFPAIESKRARGTVQAVFGIPIVVAFVVLWMFGLARFDFTIEQLLLFVLWTMVLLAAAVGLIIGLDQAAWKRTESGGMA